MVQSMQLFTKELSSVEALHAELSDCSRQNLTGRLENQKKKLTYAFNRPKIRELGQRLQKASDALQLALSVLGLQNWRQNTDKLAAVESSSQNLLSEILLVRSEIAAAETPIVNISDQLRRLCSLQGGVDATTQLLFSQYDVLSNRMQGRNNDVLRNVQETADTVNHLTQLQSKHEEETMKRHQEINEKLEHLFEHFQQNYGRKNARRAIVRQLAGKQAFLKEISDAVQPSGQSQNQVARWIYPFTLYKREGPVFIILGLIRSRGGDVSVLVYKVW
ncbi:hypothetical protein Daus18300_011520 [Diaporthe australafricana]|uniref:Uncharacterized protein n=1 Tax=Diaporthe australafricana TaxID=127596 RepID=A0ABR3W6V8_9PEZI